MQMRAETDIEPGFYTDLANETYHDTVGISSTELKAWWESVAHGLEYRNEEHEWKPSHDEGNMIHDALLGEELEYDYVWYDSTKSRSAKTYRRECRDEGVIGILPDDVEMIQRMREGLESAPDVDREWIRDGFAELSIFWRPPETGTLLKARPDYLREGEHRIDVVELKSVRGRYDHPRRFSSRIAKLDYELSAALYCDGVEQLTGKPVDYHFVVASKEPPFLVSAVNLRAETREVGRDMYEGALRRLQAWRRGDIETTGYQEEPAETNLPDWKKNLVDNRLQQIERRTQ